MAEKTLSDGLDMIRTRIPSPLYIAAGLGLIGAASGIGLWDNAVYTGGSLGRYPLRKLTGMTDEEYDQAMDELAHDPRYAALIPTALGTLTGGGYLLLKANPNQEHYGLTKWIPKTASLNKVADELFWNGGYVPDIPYHQIVSTKDAETMLSNDPRLSQNKYVSNVYTSIIHDAANQAGYTNPTLGDIYKSTANKVKSKLSWNGVTGVAANTMLANATAHLFTSALGAVLPLSDSAKRTLIDAGTWATAITSILT